jgi:hypothetical protein
VTVFRRRSPCGCTPARVPRPRRRPQGQLRLAIDAATGRLRGSFETRGIELDKDPRLEVIYDLFNMQDPVVGKGDKARAVRRAISLAIDQEWAKRHLYNDRVSRVDGPVIAEFPEYDPAFRNPWKRGPDETRAQALDRARKVLADAGVDVAALPPIEQDVQESTTDRQHFLAAQRDLAELGIRLKATLDLAGDAGAHRPRAGADGRPVGAPTTRRPRTSSSCSTARTSRRAQRCQLPEPGVRPPVRASGDDAAERGAHGAVPPDAGDRGGRLRVGRPLPPSAVHPAPPLDVRVPIQRPLAQVLQVAGSTTRRRARTRGERPGAGASAGFGLASRAWRSRWAAWRAARSGGGEPWEPTSSAVCCTGSRSSSGSRS